MVVTCGYQWNGLAGRGGKMNSEEYGVILSAHNQRCCRTDQTKPLLNAFFLVTEDRKAHK